MIKRTSNEVIISQKVNISEARAFFPDTKRCLNPELNSEVKTPQSKKLVHGENHKEKQYNPSLITGQGTAHTVDLRGERKRTEKVDLINRYQNNQTNWNKQTNHIVNKLKEEAGYDPERDFQPEEHYIDPKLQEKMDLMKKKCEVFKEIVKNNPITGNRIETPKPNGRKSSVLGEYNNKSDIYMVGDSEAQKKKEAAMIHSRKNFEQPKTDKVIQQDYPTSRRKHRDEYIKQSRVLSKSVSNLNLELREFRNGETDRKFGVRPGSISPSAQRNRGN
jgi:CRISPR/Cas system CMR-associated protein Cmr5 small subunit